MLQNALLYYACKWCERKRAHAYQTCIYFNLSWENWITLSCLSMSSMHEVICYYAIFLFWAFTENKFIFSNTYYFVSESAYAETRNTSFRCIRRHSFGPNTAIAWPAFISPSVTYRPTRRSRASQTSELRIASSKVFGRARTPWFRASPCQTPA